LRNRGRRRYALRHGRVAEDVGQGRNKISKMKPLKLSWHCVRLVIYITTIYCVSSADVFRRMTAYCIVPIRGGLSQCLVVVKFVRLQRDVLGLVVDK